jgi:drug/metabolite transporter (DMT)-like permease
MTARLLLTGCVFSLLWSSAFTVATIAIRDAPPLLVLTVRFLVAGLIGIAIAYALGQRIALNRQEWTAVIVLGICQNTLYLGACFVAVQWVQASVVVIIASMLPLLVALARWLFFSDRISFVGMLGLAIGVSGVLIMLSDKFASGANPMGVLASLVGVVALATATLLVGSTLMGNKNMLMIIGLQMLVGAITLLPLSAVFETWTINWTWSLAGTFAYLVLIAGLLATAIWFWMVSVIGPTRAATYHFLNPFFGVAIAAFVLGDPLPVSMVIGVVTIMVGILAVQLSGRSQNSERSES